MEPAKPLQETAIIAESHKVIVQYLEAPSEKTHTVLTETLSGDVCVWCKKLAEGDDESWELLKKAISGIRAATRRRIIRDKFIVARRCVKERTGKKVPSLKEFVL
jgi:hypothetical protein